MRGITRTVGVGRVGTQACEPRTRRPAPRNQFLEREGLVPCTPACGSTPLHRRDGRGALGTGPSQQSVAGAWLVLLRRSRKATPVAARALTTVHIFEPHDGQSRPRPQGVAQGVECLVKAIQNESCGAPRITASVGPPRAEPRPPAVKLADGDRTGMRRTHQGRPRGQTMVDRFSLHLGNNRLLV